MLQEQMPSVIGPEFGADGQAHEPDLLVPQPRDSIESGPKDEHLQLLDRVLSGLQRLNLSAHTEEIPLWQEPPILRDARYGMIFNQPANPNETTPFYDEVVGGLPTEEFYPLPALPPITERTRIRGPFEEPDRSTTEPRWPDQDQDITPRTQAEMVKKPQRPELLSRAGTWAYEKQPDPYTETLEEVLADIPPALRKQPAVQPTSPQTTEQSTLSVWGRLGQKSTMLWHKIMPKRIETSYIDASPRRRPTSRLVAGKLS
jgi:hypothetical protein